MQDVASKPTTVSRIFIWLTCLLALGFLGLAILTTLMTLLDLSKDGFRNFSGIATLAIGLFFVAVAFALFNMTRKLRRGAVWPALVLFLFIVPAAVFSVANSVLNPKQPSIGFATEQDVLEREEDPMGTVHTIFKPTKAEHEIRLQAERRLMIFSVIAGALPLVMVSHLRKSGVLNK